MSQYLMENKVFYFYLFKISQKSFIVVGEYAQSTWLSLVIALKSFKRTQSVDPANSSNVNP